MRWLDPPRDSVEATLREALDQAAERSGDEIAHRRVWTRIAGTPGPVVVVRGRPWVARLGVLSALGAAALGAFLIWPKGRESEPVAVLPAPTAPPVVAPAPPTVAVVRQPLLEGPRTVRSGASKRKYLRLWGGTEVDLEPSSAFSLDRQNRPSIDKGQVSLSVPPQKPGHRFTLSAGPYTIAVLGTRFQVRVGGDSVGVVVEEGVVEVSRGSRVVRVHAGEQLDLSSGTEPAARHHRIARAPQKVAVAAAPPEPVPAPVPEPAPAPSAAGDEQLRQARAALARGEHQRALALLEGLAQGQGTTAQNAAYEVGKVLRHQSRRPREALSAWYRSRTRFPDGILRVETDLSIIDTLLVVGDKAGALTEAEAFLGRYPVNERRSDISQIVQQLRVERGQSVSRRPPGATGAL
jgi:hypothetical protein